MEGQPRKRLRRNDEDVPHQDEIQSEMINHSHKDAKFNGNPFSTMGGSVQNLQRNQMMAHKQQSNSNDFYANLADQLIKPKLSTNAQAIYGSAPAKPQLSAYNGQSQYQQSQLISGGSKNTQIHQSNNYSARKSYNQQRKTSFGQQQITTSKVQNPGFGSSNGSKLSFQQESKKRTYEDFQSTNQEKVAYRYQDHAIGSKEMNMNYYNSSSSTLGATHQVQSSFDKGVIGRQGSNQNSRKSSYSNNSVNPKNQQSSSQNLTFKGVVSGRQQQAQEDSQSRQRRLRRLDNSKSYDEDALDQQIDDFEKNPHQYFEDGEHEAKALRLKNNQAQSNDQKGGKRRLKKQRVKGGIDNEDYGPEATPDEDEGGSSQDEYESDFINDGVVEELVDPQLDANNGIKSKQNGSDEEEEYYSKSEGEEKKRKLSNSGHKRAQQDEDEDDEIDNYDLLELAQGEIEGGFKYDRIDNLYYLRYGFSLPENVYHSLYEHQRVGIKWLYSLFLENCGGVLADDMGLGKTIQICVYLRGLFESEQITRVLIVGTNSILQNWFDELKKWCPTAPNVLILTDKSQKLKDQQFSHFKKKGGVMILTYGQVTSQISNLESRRADIIVVDEGHNAKNQDSNRAKNLNRLKAKVHRIILTGTPLQNNLKELYPIFNFVQPKIFQTSFQQFERDYVKPIENGLLSNAAPKVKQRSNELSQKLRRMYEPHFLRRTKDQIMSFVSAELIGRPLTRHEMPLKTDLVVWIPLSEIQRKIYKVILENQELQNMLEGGVFQTAFFYLSFIKKLCQHPLMLAQSDPKKRKLIGLLMTEEQEQLQLQEMQEEEMRKQSMSFMGIKTRKSMEEARKKQKKILRELDQPNKKGNTLKLNGEDEEEEELKSLAELNKNHKNGDEDGEWEYSADAMKRRLEKMDESKRVKIEEEKKEKEQQKLKVVQMQQENVQKLHSTLALDVVLKEIKDTYDSKDLDALIAQSSKMTFLFSLMENLQMEGHRVLIFSMSKKMLNIVEDVLKYDRYNQSFKYRRIDGCTKTEERQQICNDFNSDASIFCCLLTTRTGGFGLNLFGADRVVILDPDWNPANDNQAIDRAFRIGQKRDVIVYRLVTFSGIEEKIYQRQVYKKAINLQTIETSTEDDQKSSHTNGADMMKYFGEKDLFELFNFDYECKECETYNLLLARDGFNPVSTPTNDRHIAFLKSLKGVVRGLTLNTNLYSGTEKHNKEATSNYNDFKLKKQSNEQSEAISDSTHSYQPTRGANYKYEKRDSLVNMGEEIIMSSDHEDNSRDNQNNYNGVAYVYKNTKRLVKASESNITNLNKSGSGQKSEYLNNNGSSADKNKFAELDKYACSALPSKRISMLTNNSKK